MKISASLSLTRWLVLWFLPLVSACSKKEPALHFIPQPVSCLLQEGHFRLNAETSVCYPADRPEWLTVAQSLAEQVRAATGFTLSLYPLHSVLEQPPSNAIWIVPDERIAQMEGYVLEVKPGNVWIRARTAAGAFYGVQTLLQAGPPALFSLSPAYSGVQWTFPACRIEDYPRFSYRGLHLDVSRHFFPVAFIKRYIDLLAHHKMNVFHWHLTDDQGWRIEIKKHPRLTLVGSCRRETLSGHYDEVSRRYDGRPYCGYYTQAEIKEVVEYAKTRFVTIVPEIELPGHAMAALTAYPHLGCTGGPYEVRREWGVSDDVFCAGNDSTFVLLKDVLEEVSVLFPGKYVHIGGDECPKVRWKVCPKCQKRMKSEKLADEHALQSYVIRRASHILQQQGKTLIGWDEILEGGLAPGAVVMSWRGTEGGIAAAQAGHAVIMTPGSHCYFDFYQGNPASEPPAIGGRTPIEKVYAYEPVPDTLTAEQRPLVLGAQGNVWTEYMPTATHVEYMAYPRACALAEVLWTPAALKDSASFFQRLKTHFARLDRMGVSYSRSFYDIKTRSEKGKWVMQCNDPKAIIRYTEDGTEPHTGSRRYQGPFVPKKSGIVCARAFDGKGPLGKSTPTPVQLHKALGKPYTLRFQPERYNGGGEYALTDGQTGTAHNWDKWVGLVNHDFDPVIDLGHVVSFQRVITHFIDSKAQWIYPPRSIQVLVSDDGQNFRPLAAVSLLPAYEQALQTVVIETPRAKGRYLKVMAQNFGVIPKDVPGAGNGAWLFLDEIVVE